MSLFMRIYQNLVDSRKHLKEQWGPIGSGLERHHIVPRHAGGLDKESNYTYLTHREHRIAHWLLWKIYRKVGDIRAYHYMSSNCHLLNKGITHPNYGKKYSNDYKRKMSEKLKGRVQSKEWKEKKASSLRREIEIEGVLYSSGKEAANTLGYTSSAISTWAKRNGSRYGIKIPTGSNQWINRNDKDLKGKRSEVSY